MMTPKQVKEILATMPEGKVTSAFIKAHIARVTFNRQPGTALTQCLICLDNGFVVLGESSCADPAHETDSIGQAVAYDSAFLKLWPLYGFLLAEARYHNAMEH
jgi:Phage protein (N4 Gp49/phage Sf6 gene 66) family